MRRNALRSLVAAFCLLGMTGAAHAASGIPWAKSYSAALAQAKKTNRLIMIDFYADWCGWCKRLDATTYKDPQVVKLAAQFVPVKLDTERAGRSLAQKYGVTGLPTILFLSASGQVEGRIGGYMPPDRFAQEIKGIAQTHREFPKMVARYKAHPGDAQAALKLVQVYVKRGKQAEAVQVLTKAEQHVPKSSRSQLSRAYGAVAGGYFEQQQFSQALPYFRKAVATASTPNDIAVARIGVALCYTFQNKFREAKPEFLAAANTPGVAPAIKQQAQAFVEKLQQVKASGGP